MEIHSVVERFGADIVTTRNVLTDQHGEVVPESFTTMMGHQQGDESTKIKFDRQRPGRPGSGSSQRISSSLGFPRCTLGPGVLPEQARCPPVMTDGDRDPRR